jgi:hypothetical protein
VNPYTFGSFFSALAARIRVKEADRYSINGKVSCDSQDTEHSTTYTLPINIETSTFKDQKANK